MILIDTNVFMYAAGAEHALRAPSRRLVERIAGAEIEAAIDAETLQEILHRYRAIDRWQDGKRVYDLTRQIVPVVLPVTAAILDAAREMMDRLPNLSARDALHAAVAMEYTDGVLYSFDSDFDALPGLDRRIPA